MTDTALLLTALCLPLFAAAGITLTSRWPNLRETVTLLSSALLSITVFSIYLRFSDGAVFALDIAEPLPGLMLRFEIESLGERSIDSTKVTVINGRMTRVVRSGRE